MEPQSGAIGMIDPRHGENAPESLRNVTPDVHLSEFDWPKNGDLHGRGPYEAPYPLDAEYFLVSRAGVDAAAEGTAQWRDYAGHKLLDLAWPTRGAGYYTPQPLRPCPAPAALRLVAAGGLQGHGRVLPARR